MRRSACHRTITHRQRNIARRPRGVAAGEVEIKDRKTGARETMTIEAAINKLTSGN